MTTKPGRSGDSSVVDATPESGFLETVLEESSKPQSTSRNKVEIRLPDAFRTLGVINPDRDLTKLVNLIESVRDYDETRPLVYLEVGTWAGCSAFAASSLPNVKVFCVDHWAGSHGDRTLDLAQEFGSGEIFKTFRRNMGRRFHKTVFPYHGFSVEVAKEWKIPLDVCFLDGAHDFDNVTADINAWMPHVKPGGLLIGHDAFMFGVKRAIRRLDGVQQERGQHQLWWKKIEE